jgi:hypothetical protein
MFSSTTPSAERPDWHPVHRANALLGSALFNSGAPSAAPSQELGHVSLDATWCAIAVESAGITYPGSLSERFNALALGEEAIAVSRHERSAELRPDAADIRLHNLAAGGWDDPEANGDAEAFAAGVPLDYALTAAAPQAHVEALLHEFYRRQRRATLLVAGSLAAAVVLTFGGFLLVGSLVAHGAKSGDNRPLSHSTSVAWQRPLGFAPAQLQLASVAANRAAKGEPLLIPAVAHASEPSFAEMSPGAQVILATAGRPLALGPLLPPSPARYLFIRGLPAEAELSAGRRSSSGAWFVKDEDAQNLALSVGDAAKGDYPVDIYTLESGDAPQARRSLVLRVEAEQQSYQPAASTDCASALLDLMPSPSATVDSVVPANSVVLLKRAKSLLEEGDIAGARLILQHLAERGEGEAAYELARTYDHDALKALGARGVSADRAIAHRWYEQASQYGNAKAAERLKVLASLSVSGPSD